VFRVAEQGDEITGNVGNESEQAAIGSNIKQVKNEGGAASSHVHIYPPAPEKPQRRPARKTGKLMPDEAAELRQAIDRLTEKMSQSNIAVTELRGTVGQNNAITMRSINAFEEQMTIFKAQVMARAPVWIAYLTVTMLIVIAIAVTVASVVLIYLR
jgi:hypothetical protein